MTDSTRRSWIRSWRAPIIVALLAVALVGGWLAWRHFDVAEVPRVDFAGVDPEIIEAVEQASDAVRAAPRSAAAWGRLGMVLRAHDFAPEANVCFAQAQRLDDSDPRWPYLRGLTIVLTDRDAAIPLLESAVAKFGRQTAPRLRLAEALALQGRADEAERHFRQVISDERGNPRAHLGLARLAHARGNANEALDHIHKAITHPLTQKSALMLRAQIRQHQGQADLARADLRQAADLPEEPGWPDPLAEEVAALRVGLRARLARADDLLRRGLPIDAVAVLEEAARKAPDADAVPFQLGQTLRTIGDYPRAEQAFRRAIDLAPNVAAAHFELGTALALQKKHKLAADAYRQAIEILPSHSLAHYNLGHSLLELGDKAGAAAAFRDALRYRPDFANAHINLGDLLAQKGDDATALEHLETALRLSPGEQRATRLAEEIRKRLASSKKQSKSPSKN